jgi:hypothetical protein
MAKLIFRMRQYSRPALDDGDPITRQSSAEPLRLVCLVDGHAAVHTWAFKTVGKLAVYFLISIAYAVRRVS